MCSYLYIFKLKYLEASSCGVCLDRGMDSIASDITKNILLAIAEINKSA